MKYVYLIRSKSRPGKTYIGITEDLEARLKAHNEGSSAHTARFRPWKLEVALAFQQDEKAEDSEEYLRSGSGRAFAKRHFW
ncbi:MAG: GIY-YIG nuclease family protein [Candidatus Brocadiaceae bacterium]